MNNYTPMPGLCDHLKGLFIIAGNHLRDDLILDSRRPITTELLDRLVNGLSHAYPLSREVDTSDEIFNGRNGEEVLTQDIGDHGSRVLVFYIGSRRWRLFDRESGRSFSRSRNWERIIESDTVVFVIDSNGDYVEYL